jgi:LysR family transcriptional regulator, glycine cleavage system transcriptional activator
LYSESRRIRIQAMTEQNSQPSAVSVRLPPLRSLQAFEATARHLNFSRAAKELFVTHGAVSRQVRLLESLLNVRLLKRGPRGASLTPEGQALYRRVRQGFDNLSAGIRDAAELASTGTITVTLSVSLASKWLVPRLARFRDRVPGVAVRVVADDQVVELDRIGGDVALRYGSGNWPGKHVERLMTEELIVVGSSQLLPKSRLSLEPREILGLPLLHDEYHCGWVEWARFAGVDMPPNAYSAMHFADTSLLIEAVMAGDSVALVRRSLAAADMLAGRLIQLSKISLPVHHSLYFVCQRDDLRNPLVAQFREWTIDEISLSGT